MRLTIIKDVYDLESYEFVEGGNLLEALRASLGAWPENARLYHEEISERTEVTPRNERDIDRLLALDGDFYCVVVPGAEFVIPAIIAVVAIVFAVVAMKQSKIPVAATRNDNLQSSNNKLSARTNEARPGARVPDIFGQVRSYPDLVSPTYDEFIGNVQVENQLLCIGRGQYEIHDVRDGDTVMSHVSGASVEIYQPGKDIVADEPYYSVGPKITDIPLIATRSNNIDGLPLRPANAGYFNLNGVVRLEAPNKLELKAGQNMDFTDIFYAGEVITLLTRPSALASSVGQPTSRSGVLAARTIGGKAGDILDIREFTWGGVDLTGIYTVTGVSGISATCETEHAWNPGTVFCGYSISLAGAPGVNPNWNSTGVRAPTITTGLLCRQCSISGATIKYYQFDPEQFTDYSGEYEIEAVLPTTIILKNPEEVNPNWANIADLPNGVTAYMHGHMTVGDTRWSNTFMLDDPDLEEVWLNITAPQGLYKDNGQKQTAVNVQVMAELTPVDANGRAIGDMQTFTAVINGSSESRAQQALTMKIKPDVPGRQQIRLRRVTNTDTGYSGTVVDEIQWRDCYAMKHHPFTNWGDFTMVRARTLSTVNASSLKERKLNCLVTRQLPIYDYDGTTPGVLTSTRSFADALIAVALDPHIGGRSLAELDLENYFDTMAAIMEYFGTSYAAEFCYTFDSFEISFEETVSMIAQAVFCEAYRQGNVIRLFFEKAEDIPAVLFNHRNKMPGSEKRTVTFGMADDNDGIELEYVSPADDAVLTLYIPEDRSAVNPKRIETIGVRNNVQAHFRAWREYQKIKHQHVATEFEALDEARLLVRGNKILVADNTRAEKWGGEITRQDGLVVYSSQPLHLEAGKNYTAFLQLADATVQSLAVSAGPAADSFILSAAPRVPLVADDDRYIRTLFTIIENPGEERNMAFLLTQRDALSSDGGIPVQAINYDARYYAHDRDFRTGQIKLED